MNKDISTIQSTRTTAIVMQYLHPQDGPILEGGCGCGEHVAALVNNNYHAIGIDSATKTVLAITRRSPRFDIRPGDIQAIPFPDDYFAGYLSLGVIEHFEGGYARALSEMRRVIKDDGYLFLAFPYMSPIRKIKSWIRAYPLWTNSKMPEDFYQFALDVKSVVCDLRQLGFYLIQSLPMDNDNGLREELPSAHAWIGKLHAYKGKSILIRILRRMATALASTLSAHSVLLVLQKTPAPVVSTPQKH
ncbi:MAG: class I SAM-dependent methyltransferase [Candidatus Omnitrophica bacterium]|nr:class I SAM-dependent methyltransferase [Candidatus Omnitrophota bacterium]